MFIAALVQASLSCSIGAAELRLAPLFSDHLVIQRETVTRVWGEAAPGAAVEVVFGGVRVSAKAAESGRFVAELPPFAASSEPRSLVVTSGSERVAVADVLVGEVWFCSGQSNMEWQVRICHGADDAQRSATDPRLRTFKANVTFDYAPVAEVGGAWSVATPESVLDFSATAFYFGRELLAKLDVPIGLLDVSWGGSAIEAWTSLDALRPLATAKRFLDDYDRYSVTPVIDPLDFAAPSVDESNWEHAKLPAFFADLGHAVTGTIWFRRHVAIPESWVGRELRLRLGPIDDNDITYWNGERIGATEGWTADRDYTIAAERVVAGDAVLVVEVKNGSGPGGIYGAPDALSIGPVDDPAAAIPLAGDWRMKLGVVSNAPDPRARPAHIYHGMVHPLLDARFRGVIWYQGESNALDDRGAEYYEILPAMITDWRRRFDQGDFPFLIVQLPNFAPDDSFWRYQIVRDAQLATYRNTKNVGLAVTLELGDPHDIHPGNKLDVGRRLARLAFHDVYGFADVVPTGPFYQRHEIEGDRVRITFDLFGSKLVGRAADGSPAVRLDGFEIAGDDGMFVAAEATLDGDTVVVRSAEVEKPAAVRYAYEGVPPVSLFNAAGLPASPFHTTPWSERGE
jgi:sialate O-acetylesterase